MTRTTFACLMVVAAGIACGRERVTQHELASLAKRCTATSEMSCPRPIVNVRSLRDSQRYYRDALGFKVDWSHGTPPDFGAVSRADAQLFMCQGCQGTPGAWMMICPAR